MNRRLSGGYALLSALVIVAIAALAGASCFAAINARLAIDVTDAEGAATAVAEAETLSATCDSLRWSPPAGSGKLTRTLDSGARTTAAWSSSAPTSQGTPRIAVSIVSAQRAARRQLDAVVELRTEECAQGVVVAGDAELRATTRVLGSGVCIGGSLEGREYLSFTDDDSSQSTDIVHPDLWRSAAVHAVGSIFAAGQETHLVAGQPTGSWVHDTDAHTADNRDILLSLLRAPVRAHLVALMEHSIPLEGAFAEGRLDLSQLPEHAPSETTGAACAGLVVYLRPEPGDTVTIVGTREPEGCPLTLVVDGDAAIAGADGQTVSTSGAIVVLGSLRVTAALSHTGQLYAGQLTLTAPTQIRVPADWRQHPPIGLVDPTIVGLDDQ